MKRETYQTQIVDGIPPTSMLEDGILYVSPNFHVAVHKCMCGCGEVVVIYLDVDTNGWSWSFDGINVSLQPSISNLQQPCKSQYFLKDGKVQWL